MFALTPALYPPDAPQRPAHCVGSSAASYVPSPNEVALPPLACISYKIRLTADNYARLLPKPTRLNVIFAASTQTYYLSTSKFTQGTSGKALLAVKLVPGAPPLLEDLRILKKVRRRDWAYKCALKQQLEDCIDNALQLGTAPTLAPPTPAVETAGQKSKVRTLVSSSNSIARESIVHRATRGPVNLFDVFDLGCDTYLEMTAMDLPLSQVGAALKDPSRRRAGMAFERAGLALWFGLQLSEELAQLHSCGLVHRDISSSNILVDIGRGIAGLSDFGRASPTNIFASGTAGPTPKGSWGAVQLRNFFGAPLGGYRMVSLAVGTIAAPEAVAPIGGPAPQGTAAELLAAGDVWALAATLVDFLAEDIGLRPLNAATAADKQIDDCATRARTSLFRQAWRERTMLGASATERQQQTYARLCNYLDSVRSCDARLASVLIDQVLLRDAHERLSSMELHEALRHVESGNPGVFRILRDKALERLAPHRLIQQPLACGLMKAAEGLMQADAAMVAATTPFSPTEGPLTPYDWSTGEPWPTVQFYNPFANATPLAPAEPLAKASLS